MSLPNPPNLVIGMFNYNTYTIDIVPKSTLFPTVSNIFYLVMPIITNIMYIHNVNDCSLLYYTRRYSFSVKIPPYCWMYVILFTIKL